MKKGIAISIVLVLIAFAIFLIQVHSSKEKTLMEIKIEDGIPYGKRETDSDWVRLGNAISPPQEWATDDLAGRNTATTLFGSPEIFAQMVSEKDGWIVVTYGHGVAIADTYVYKTSDKGKTWKECVPPPLEWYVSAVGFINEDRLLIGSKIFNKAPVILTIDGGDTWIKIQLPEPKAELQSVDIGENIISMTLTCGDSFWTMISSDLGNTWETVESIQR